MKKIKFKDYPLDNKILKALNILEFKELTKVQSEVIPCVLANKDVVVQSQTGSGKTAAFAIPICEMVDWEENLPQALVLTPTRELAIQIDQDIRNIGRFKRLKSIGVYGKASFIRQEKALRQKTHVVVGTPGRVKDHLDRGTLTLEGIKYVVIDEADEMLSMGFIEEVAAIIKEAPKKRVTMLFSATLPDDIKRLSDSYMQDPVYVEIKGTGITIETIEHQRYQVVETDKIKLLQDITIIENPDSCIIFCNTKQRVDDVAWVLSNNGYSCEKIHGGMEQDDRMKVMEGFKQGYFRYLVATDVAARGIDVDNITHVIHYDLPLEAESYVHRTGRTGRAGKSGKAIALVTPYEDQSLADIHAYIGFEIPLVEAPRKEQMKAHQAMFDDKMDKRPVIKADISLALEKEIMKLHIASGRKSKMRPTDIVGTISNLKGVTAEDIGIIDIQDISSFVEILNNKGETVLEQLQTTPIKGRLRRVSIKN